MRWLTWGCVFTVLFASLAAPVAAETHAAPSIAQQGLTLFEIDRELGRLQDQENTVTAQIAETERSLERQEAALKQRGEAAGRVLRAYYVGQRDRLWLLLLRMGSFREAMVTLDYMYAIIRTDFQILHSYKEALEERKLLLASLEQRKSELRQTISDYESQRIRLVELQAELDRQLSLLTAEQQQAELAQLEMLTTIWEQEGIPLFEDVLSALSAAMVDVPQLLTDQSRMELSGTNIQIRITDSDFNAFLKERNELFTGFQFMFTNEGMTVTGKMEDKTATITGSYVLEKEPTNMIRFRIDSVVFNEYELPDTTRNALEERYKLTFEPGRLYAGLQATDVSNQEGELQVKLTFTGFPLAFGQR